MRSLHSCCCTVCTPSAVTPGFCSRARISNLSRVRKVLGTNKHVLCRIKNDDGVLLTCISNFDKSYTVRELGEGEELFVNYGSERGFESSPIEMFVDYGFVPEEMLEVAHGPPGDDEDFDIYDD